MALDITDITHALRGDEMAGNVERSPIPRKHLLRKERVISAEELGTMSKNNLREITLGIRPIWRINSLILSSLGTV